MYMGKGTVVNLLTLNVFLVLPYRASEIIMELNQLLQNQSTFQAESSFSTTGGLTAGPSGGLTAGPTGGPTYQTNHVFPPSLGHFSLHRPDSVRASLSRLFQPYPKGNNKKTKQCSQPWEHKFFCCARLDTQQSPSLEDTMILQACGLGGKNVLFNDVQGTLLQFIHTMEKAFPPLISSGGFKLMRCGKSKQLIDIMPQGGYTADYLKNLSNLNKAVAYIVPLQADLPWMRMDKRLNMSLYILYIFLCYAFMSSISIFVYYILGWKCGGVVAKLQQLQSKTAVVFLTKTPTTLQHEVSHCNCSPIFTIFIGLCKNDIVIWSFILCKGRCWLVVCETKLKTSYVIHDQSVYLNDLANISHTLVRTGWDDPLKRCFL